MGDIDIDKVYSKISDFIDSCQATFLNLAAMKNLSPIYNDNWETDGDLLSCFNQMVDYINTIGITGLENLTIFQDKGVTPSLFFTVPSNVSGETYTILLYSHIDKIPFGDKWTKCDPSNPKVIGDALYGRGVSTSMYAIFTILGMLKTIQELQDLPMLMPNIAVLLESSFESGSPDLVTNLEKVLDIVTINHVICLDTWGVTGDHFHYMKSCRGLIQFDLRITTGLKEVHSGSFGGLIPDPMMVLNNILSNRVETIEITDATNVKIPVLEVEVTEDQKAECQSVVDACGTKIISILPYEGASQLIGSKNKDVKEDCITAYINGALRPSFTILGFEKMPSIENASGSLKPDVNARLCFRTPPSLDVNTGSEQLMDEITKDPPFNAIIDFPTYEVCSGVDLEDCNNMMTEKMINCFNGYCEKKIETDSLPLRMARSLPCLNFLTAKLKDVPIFMTGAGDTDTGNPRNGDENISLSKLKDFSTCLTCYVSDYRSYKE